jgi:hypothetical protein
MRRDPRPFVVEVRRGQKKTPAAPVPAPVQDRGFDDDLMRRAEEALFGKPAVVQAPDPEAGPADPAAGDPKQPRRILEAIVPEAEEAEVPVLPEPVRRGRKPGSKNRPKETLEAEAPVAKRRRGRPRKHPDSEVRSVRITPELESAALDFVSRSAPAASMPGQEASEPDAAMPAHVEPRRPRGRPRREAPVEADTATAEAPPAVTPGGMSAARIVQRYQAGGEPPAGRKWTRRLRGYAHPDRTRRRPSGPGA